MEHTFTTIEEFAKEIERQLRNQFPSFQIESRAIEKNNGVTLTGLTIKAEENNIAPNIYVNSFFEQFKNGNKTIDEVVSDIVDIYENSKVSNVNLEYLTDFQQVKSCLSAKVLNFERNKNMIANNNLVYKLLTDDLVIIPTIKIDLVGSGVISISKSLFEKWEITEKALFKAVKDSLESKPYSIRSIFECIGEPESPFHSMYVLTNIEAVHGASELLNDKAMKALCDKLHSTSIIILPSSIHEIIALPNDESADIDELITIVRSVNATTVSSTDFLSNSVYIYDKESEKIEIYNN